MSVFVRCWLMCTRIFIVCHLYTKHISIIALFLFAITYLIYLIHITYIYIKKHYVYYNLVIRRDVLIFVFCVVPTSQIAFYFCQVIWCIYMITLNHIKISENLPDAKQRERMRPTDVWSVPDTQGNNSLAVKLNRTCATTSVLWAANVSGLQEWVIKIPRKIYLCAVRD